MRQAPLLLRRLTRSAIVSAWVGLVSVLLPLNSALAEAPVPAPTPAASLQVAASQPAEPAWSYGPYTVHRIETAGDAGPIRGWVARIDLTTPGLDVMVTGQPGSPVGENCDSILEATSIWAHRRDADLAVNANFFGWRDRTKGWSDVIGLSVSDGEVISPPRVFEDKRDLSFLFLDNGKAVVASPTDKLLAQATEAVSGVGPNSSLPQRDQALVTDGRNTADHARVAPGKRHPRTAIGVSANGQVVIVMVIDGRREGWSVGVTLPELAELMIAQGAHQAINLDGGGSSAFVVRDPETDAMIHTNRPSDGIFRPVANNLGFRYAPPPRE